MGVIRRIPDATEFRKRRMPALPQNYRPRPTLKAARNSEITSWQLEVVTASSMSVQALVPHLLLARRNN